MTKKTTAGGQSRATGRESRRSALLARNQRQLDEFYSPVLGRLERIRDRSKVRLEHSDAMSASQSSVSSEEMQGAIDFNNNVLRDELLPLYREVAELFQENAGLVEPSTKAIRYSLVSFIDVWDRNESAKISFEVLQKLQKGGATKDPLEPLYKDVKGHVDRLNRGPGWWQSLTGAQATILAAVVAVVPAGATFFAKLPPTPPPISETEQMLKLRDSVRTLTSRNQQLADQLAGRQHWLIITGVHFADSGAHARLIATVDGIPTSFPSAAAWADGDAFPSDSAPLLRDMHQHQVRFALHYFLPHASLRQAGSAEVLTLHAVPYAGEYRLYEDPGGVSGRVVARVRYEIRTGGRAP